MQKGNNKIANINVQNAVYSTRVNRDMQKVTHSRTQQQKRMK